MSARVIVVGSLHYDIMVKAPDRPRKGETVLGSAWWPKCGGKGGNQAVEAALSGAPTLMIGAVGDDDFGRVLTAHLACAGVDATGVAVIAGASSGMSVAIEDAGGDYGAVVVSGVNRLFLVDDGLAAGWTASDVVVLQNEIDPAANLAAARRAKAVGACVIHNAAPALPLDPDFLDLIDVLVVNAIEAEMMGGGSVTDLLSAEDAARQLAVGGRTAVVTAGGDGVAWAGPEGGGSMEALQVVLRSTHGAGDCFVGVLAASLGRGEAIAAAVARANAAAGNLVSLTQTERASRRPEPRKPLP